MIVIKPEMITEAKLIASNVPENDAPLWSSATNYTIGQRVIFMHRVYEALTNNHNKRPDTHPLDWADLGATNRYRMFDSIVSNPTTNPMQLDYTIRPGAVVTGIALFNLDAASVRVQMTDPTEGLVYDQTIDLVDLTAITSYYNYFFEPVGERRTDLTFLNLPTYPLADIRILIDNGNEIAMCGEIALGAQRTLGLTNFGTSVGIRDYSRKETDVLGNVIIVERRFSKIADYAVSFRNTEIASIQRFLASIRATPVVWIGKPDLDELLVYGFYKDFNISISDLNFSDSTIQVEGLT